MTTRVRVSGTLSHPPESRTLKAGRVNATATTATLMAKDGNYTQFWRIAAFSDPVQVELMRLSAGDAVAVEGALKAELYDRNGEIDLSFGVIAEHVLPLRQPGKKRRKEGPAATNGEREFCHETHNSFVHGSARNCAGHMQEDPTRSRARRVTCQ